MIKYFLVALSAMAPLQSEAAKPLPEKMVQIMKQPKYDHAFWGVYVKGGPQVFFNLNEDRFFLPASTTKLFSVAALVDAYGNDYRFKTPVYAWGDLKEGKLRGDLVLVGQGDLTFGGRHIDADTIAYTKMDHIIANNVPGVILTEQDPLFGLKSLAAQVKAKGIKEINGDILIDTRLFETVEKREMTLSPIFLNENLIDFTFLPTKEHEGADVEMRPKVEGYTLENQVLTVGKSGKTEIFVEADETGKKMRAKGTISLGTKNAVRVLAIQDPAAFVKSAFIELLKAEGIAINLKQGTLPPSSDFQKHEPVALFTSPPLSEYAKLILKVSHNLGADLVPLLLAAKQGETTSDAGMKLFGDFVTDKPGISKNSFLFEDAAGGDGNRLTLEAEVKLLTYLQHLPKEEFQKFYDALPILGVDGSLEDFGKKTSSVHKVLAKTGTGVAFNRATGEFFLTTQALAGYMEDKNGELIPFIVVVNNANMSTIDDVVPIFEDIAQVAAALQNSLD